MRACVLSRQLATNSIVVAPRPVRQNNEVRAGIDIQDRHHTGQMRVDDRLTTSGQAALLWMGDAASKSSPVATQTPLWVNDLPRADWYPDPLDGGQLRFWNGLGWDEQTMPSTPGRRQEVPGEDLFVNTRDGAAKPATRKNRRDSVRAALFSAFGHGGEEPGDESARTRDFDGAVESPDR